MKKLYFIIAILIFSCNSFAHKEWVHQYIVQQAYDLLVMHFDISIPDSVNR